MPLIKPVTRLLRYAQAADPRRHGWRVVDDVIGVDPWLLSEWVREGARSRCKIFQIDAGGHTAWGFWSVRHFGFLVADTVYNQPVRYTDQMVVITWRALTRLAGEVFAHKHLESGRFPAMVDSNHGLTVS